MAAIQFQFTRLNPKTEIEMGRARASRAVFRALAENLEHTR